jgi:DNA-binding NarL/FixJ family response regulator
MLADDYSMVREGLRSLLQGQPDIEVVAEAENGRTAVELASKLLPDVVVMDINMPDLNGIDATRQIIAAGDGIKIIGLSGHAKSRFAGELLKVGASGFVCKESAFHELVDAIRTVIANRVYISPALSIDETTNPGGAPLKDCAVSLSTREREILQLLAEGKAMKEVARCLQVSLKTVETHRRNIMQKLDVHSVAELTKYAIREGITFLET